jgi:hypothetical protein
MNVAELIKELKKYPPDMLVFGEGDAGIYWVQVCEGRTQFAGEDGPITNHLTICPADGLIL